MKIKVILASSSQDFVKSRLEDRKKSLAQIGMDEKIQGLQKAPEPI